MNKAIKKTVPAALLFFLFANICAADGLQVENAKKEFAEEIQRYLPFTALTALAWSDSYIGQLVSRKPHFGAGISYGMSTAGFSAARDLLAGLDVGGYLNTDGVFMPPMYVHARIGGFFLPFDIGIVASIPVYAQPADNVISEQQTVGGDIRFALVRDGPKLPGVSLGIAYTQTEGSLSVSGKDFDTRWGGGAVEVKAQISKTFQTITPYFGLGGSYTWTYADHYADGKPRDAAPKNFANGMLFRVFGGASIKLWALRLDMGMNVSIPDAAYGVVLGLRFQL